MPPADPPSIATIVPAPTIKVGSGTYFFILKVGGSNLRMESALLINGKAVERPFVEPSGQYVQGVIPEELWTKPGHYPVQVKTDKGLSNILYVDIVPATSPTPSTPSTPPPTAPITTIRPLSSAVLPKLAPTPTRIAQ
jgi:hypothetical protein